MDARQYDEYRAKMVEGGEDMKIQLDTENKTIKIEADVLLSKLVKTLESLLPNKEWEKYTLQTNTVIEHWSNPHVIHEHYNSWPHYPWTFAYTSSRSANNTSLSLQQLNTSSIKPGTYNIEV